MKTSRLLPFLLLAVSPASAQLSLPAPDRLADYHAWFDPFAPANGVVAPDQQTPGSTQITDTNRVWSGWLPPPASLPGPIQGFDPGVYCEVVFIGETGLCWRDFGYQLNGVDYLLSQTSADRQFGGHFLPLLTSQDAINFFIESVDETGASNRQYALASTPDVPIGSPGWGYFGFLTPLTSVRGDMAGFAGSNALPFAVLAFTPDADTPDVANELFVFALRAGEFHPTGVPEPATYGLVAAGALLALVARRRRLSGI